MSLLNANAVLGGWCLGVGGFKADGLTGVGGGLQWSVGAPQKPMLVVPEWDIVEC